MKSSPARLKLVVSDNKGVAMGFRELTVQTVGNAGWEGVKTKCGSL